MGNILVLGSNGFIGHNLVSALVRNHNVVGYDLNEEQYKYDNYVHVCGDFTQEQNFSCILKEYEIDTIYHLISTCVPSETTDRIIDEVMGNIVPTLRILEAMKECNVRSMIFASSGGTVYGEGHKVPHQEKEILEPICSYGIQKVSIEMYLKLYRHLYGMNTIITRISNPYGVLKEEGRTQGIIPIFLNRLFLNEDISLFGDTLRDYIYIDDVIDALVELYTYKGKEHVFNIGTGIPVGLKELVSILEIQSNKQFRKVENLPIRKCDVEDSVLDISLVEKELNWRPTVTLEEGIRRIIQKIY